MTDQELLMGLHAYQSGCVDSGIHDTVAEAELRVRLNATSENALRVWLSKAIRKEYLTNAQLTAGYGWEDVREFIEWFEEWL